MQLLSTNGETRYVSTLDWDVFDPGMGEGETLDVLDLLKETEHEDPSVVFFAPPGQSIAEEKFKRLSEQWYNASLLMSSARDMAMLPSYQKIIGMGWTAVPLILRELEKEPAHWFWALRAITDADPVDAENKGRVDLMASQWVEWGRNLGLI